MAKTGENIYKRKDGKWEGRYIKERVNGKIHYGYVFADSLEEAREKRRYAMEGLNLQGTDADTGEKAAGCFLTDVAGEWFDDLRPQLKESSRVKYRNILNSYILPEFGTHIISGITAVEVNSYVMRLLDTGGMKGQGLSPKTTTGILSVLKLIMDYARQVKGLSTVCLDGITVKQTQKVLRILSMQEQNRLDSYLRDNPSPRNMGIIVCLYSGIRLGEICALKWGDILADEEAVYIQNTMLRLQTDDDPDHKTKIIITRPKSECSIRRIPLPDEIYRLISAERKSDDAYFLTGLDNLYVEPRTMENHFKSVINSCGVDDANFHALRHTFATRCVELGFDIKSLSEILGHASVSITLNRYVHPSMATKKRNMNRLSEIMTKGAE